MPPVVDANVLIHGRGRYPFKSAYTVPEMFDELKSSGARLKADTVDLKPEEPGKEEIERVKKKSEEIGSNTSKVDEKLLALALTLDTRLITDDKDLQNLALHLEADFEGFMEPAVEEKRRWVEVCDNCGREISSLPCPHCGSEQSSRKPD
ncbi:MAG: hypothetical protein ABEJ69_03725 [Candidatus Nanohaloarchaea archaeon]